MKPRTLLIAVGLVACSILAALAYWRVARLEGQGTPVVSRDLFGAPVAERPAIDPPPGGDRLTPPAGLDEANPGAGVRLDGPVGEPEVGPKQPWEPPAIMAYA